MRRVHWVGSYPETTIDAAMRGMIQLSGEHLHAIPDGEPGRSWIDQDCVATLDLPAVRTLRRGVYRSYADLPIAWRRVGRELVPPMPHAARATAMDTALSLIQAETAGPPVVRQVGIPDPYQMPAFLLGLWRDRDAFVAETLHQVEMIHRALAAPVLQIECPTYAIKTVLLARLSYRSAARYADKVAARMADYIADCPAGMDFAVHLCTGDLGAVPVAHPSTVAPMVMLANAIAAHWPSGRTLATVHLPMCTGNSAPSPDPAYYTALAELELPEHTRLAAGFISPQLPTAALAGVLDLVETALDREVDVATHCGLGRMSLEHAEQAGKAARELAAH